MTVSSPVSPNWPTNRTGENRTGEPRPLAWTLSWALPWMPSWDDSWELSWGVLDHEGLKTGKINPRGSCRGRSRGRSCGCTRGSTRGPTRGATRGPTRGSRFTFACSVRRPPMLQQLCLVRGPSPLIFSGGTSKNPLQNNVLGGGGVHP